MHAPPRLRVAFGGRMQVGKTTAADHLVERHAFVKYALADPIKVIARRDFGWDGTKDPRGRRLLQEIGDVGRRYDPDLWLDRFAARLAVEPAPRVVVDDVRLAREVDFLRALDFTIVRVTRPFELIDSPPLGDPGRDHSTETGLEDVPVDGVVDNRGTVADLHAWLDRLVGEMRTRASS